MNEMIKLQGFFIGEPDRCERLISGLHYCLEGGVDATFDQEEQLYTVSLLLS
jgi:hypothetical protein